jgi:hypothetical protein
MISNEAPVMSISNPVKLTRAGVQPSEARDEHPDQLRRPK